VRSILFPVNPLTCANIDAQSAVMIAIDKPTFFRPQEVTRSARLIDWAASVFKWTPTMRNRRRRMLGRLLAALRPGLGLLRPP
jgi:hypothetical protein